MTKQRIILSSRQIIEDKSRAVRRARNGAISKCLEILKTLDRVKYGTGYPQRIILPKHAYDNVIKDIRGLIE